ncbi:RVT 3 domain-containing [Abeliophyllum distichum]|uniref:RVT 3 domain-containing n=1 Tax=Abeliophyllum distichum TaxID=126358 RepID=A0ABD1VYX8_9LAMI
MDHLDKQDREQGYKLNCMIRFDFKASNNVVEYEALLAGLCLAKDMYVKRLSVGSDSQLVVCQVNENFTIIEKGITAYLKLVRKLIPCFEKFELIQDPRANNDNNDALSKLANKNDSELLIWSRLSSWVDPRSKPTSK